VVANAAGDSKCDDTHLGVLVEARDIKEVSTNNEEARAQ